MNTYRFARDSTAHTCQLTTLVVSHLLTRYCPRSSPSMRANSLPSLRGSRLPAHATMALRNSVESARSACSTSSADENTMSPIRAWMAASRHDSFSVLGRAGARTSTAAARRSTARTRRSSSSSVTAGRVYGYSADHAVRAIAPRSRESPAPGVHLVPEFKCNFLHAIRDKHVGLLTRTVGEFVRRETSANGGLGSMSVLRCGSLSPIRGPRTK